MSIQLVLATGNMKKLNELQEIIRDLDINILTLHDFPDLPPIDEDGATFEANAIKKAVETARATGYFALADDSGLEVDALNGRPGVYSARFAGEPSDDARNNAKLLALLGGVPEEQRTARFRCVIAVAAPDGRFKTAEGTCEGRIAFKPAGSGGFGYDPLFVPNGYEQTFAELPATIKNQISHRGQALHRIRPVLESLPEL